MSDKNKDKAIDDILANATDKTFNKSDNVVDTPDTAKKHKLILGDDEIELSEEEVEESRKKILDIVDNHISKIKKEMDKDNLANYMLENRIELLEKSKYMLNEYMVTILTQLSSSSRAFEVLAKFIETVAGINDSVVNVAEDKKKTKTSKDDKEIIMQSNELINTLVKKNIDGFMTEVDFRNKNKENIKVSGGKKTPIKKVSND